MSIGLGIFLSALIFGSLLLYYITRDRWNWKRTGRRIGIAIGGLVLVIVILALGFWGYQKIDSLPRRQIAYADLTLGMKMAEVRYIKGEPSYVSLPPTKSGPYAGWAQIVCAKDFKKGQTAESFSSWSYELGDEKNYVEAEFDRKTRTLKTVTCYSGGIAICPPLLGIVDGDTEESVIQRLGKPTEQVFEVGAGVKRLTYGNLNARYYLIKKRVYMLQMSR